MWSRRRRPPLKLRQLSWVRIQMKLITLEFGVLSFRCEPAPRPSCSGSGYICCICCLCCLKLLEHSVGCYNKYYQQMRLFVLCLYFLFLVFSLHVSGLHGPIIRGISSCCFYATIWFMQCFVHGLRASADWFVVVTLVY